MTVAEHGTYARYSAKPGCRCDECKAAKATYIRERRRVARETARRSTTNLKGLVGNGRRNWPANVERHFVPGVKHGSSYAYYERGCRCRDCTSWESAEWLARAARRRQVTP